MDIFEILPQQLYQSGGLVDESWKAHGISVIADLEGNLDVAIPTEPNSIIYIYFPIEDGNLPDMQAMQVLAKTLSGLIDAGRKVLTHCAAGCNRASLMNGCILLARGIKGTDAIQTIRNRRGDCALRNTNFEAWLAAQ